jgi:hypothetical protein
MKGDTALPKASFLTQDPGWTAMLENQGQVRKILLLIKCIVRQPLEIGRRRENQPTTCTV